MNPTAPVIHFIAYAAQPDIQFACDQTWGTPAWAGHKNEEQLLPAGCFWASNGYAYTFDIELATCPACLQERGER